ncbi:MAG: TolC family protein, partial [Rhodothermaceae bacterium]|nr:TolC family protein [Rhodothermaceae bacterium]
MIPLSPHRWTLGLAMLALGTTLLALPARAQMTPTADPITLTLDPITLTLDEALQIALVQNYALQRARLDVDNARAQVSEGWGQLFPQVDVNASYTRNVRSANPFSGSDAGGLFQSLGFLDWLAFNEQARTDDDATTNPIDLGEFFSRQQAGLDAAGVPPVDSGNPFSVPNQLVTGITVNQKVFDARVLLGATGASKYLAPFSQQALERQEQLLIDQVKRAYFQALLAGEQARVARLSVSRTQATVTEVGRRVTQGVAPKFERLSAEVELANLETQFTQSENAAAAAIDNLRLSLGIPVAQPLRLRGALEAGAAGLLTIGLEDAAQLALDRRPDLEQARINIELQKIQTRVAKAAYLPALDAFANLNYIGNVPSNRLSVLSDPNDPFAFTTRDNGVFSSNYWDLSAAVGFRLSWNIFNGLQTTRQVQQRKIARTQAEIDHEQLARQIRVEVEQAIRNLRSAQQRLLSQGRNVERAELNYSYAESRYR